MENPINKVDVKIEISRNQYIKWLFIPNFKRKNQFRKGAIEKEKCKINLNKPTYIRAKILDLTLFRVGIFVAAQWWGRPKRPSSIKSVTYILQWWNFAVIHYLRKIQKIYESRDTPFEFRGSLRQKLATFVLL